METPDPKGLAIGDSPDNPAERKRAEEALRDSEVRYRRLFEAARDGILILDAETGMIVDVNPFLTELLGYSHEQFLGKAIWDLGCFRDVIANLDKFLELQRQEYVRYENLPLETADGRRIEVEFVSNVYLVDHKEVVQCNIRDMTAHRRAERALRESEARFDQLAAQSGVVVWEVDAHGLYTHVSHVSESIWGYRPDEVVGRMHFYDLHPEAGREKFKKAAFAAFERNEPFRDLLNATEAKDGRLVWVSTNGIPLLNPDGTLRGYHGSDTDVTERRRAEEALRKSEERYKALFDRSLDLVYVNDLEGRFIDANEAALDLLGYEREEIRGLTFASLLSEDQLPAAFEAAREIRDTGVQRGLTEFRLRSRNGSDVYVETKGAAILSGGRVLAIQSIARDITERKRAEQALRKTEAQLRLALEGASAVAWVADFGDGTVTEAGPVERVFGKPAGLRHLDEASFLQDIHPDDRARVIACLQSGKEAFSVEYRVPLPDGGVRWLQASGRFEYDSGGRPVRLLGIALDITEHKRAKERIESQLAELQRWQDAMLGREDRVQELKREVNELSRRVGEPARYPSQEAGPAEAEGAEPS